MEQVQRLSQRWAEGLRVAEGRLPFMGRVQNLFSDAGSFLKKLWTFELFTAEDTITVEGQKITGKRSVTLGKIVMAILILGLGIWITGLISRVTEPIIIRRLKIEANQARLDPPLVAGAAGGLLGHVQSGVGQNPAHRLRLRGRRAGDRPGLRPAERC